MSSLVQRSSYNYLLSCLELQFHSLDLYLFHVESLLYEKDQYLLTKIFLQKVRSIHFENHDEAWIDILNTRSIMRSGWFTKIYASHEISITRRTSFEYSINHRRSRFDLLETSMIWEDDSAFEKSVDWQNYCFRTSISTNMSCKNESHSYIS